MVTWRQPNRAACRSLKTKLNAERQTNQQRLKESAVKACQSISQEETRYLEVKQSLAVKVFHPTVKKQSLLVCPVTSEPLKSVYYVGYKKAVYPKQLMH